ncbi:MAG: hypothetical protein AAF689_15005 [Pseudomonadota bacterium]
MRGLAFLLCTAVFPVMAVAQDRAALILDLFADLALPQTGAGLIELSYGAPGDIRALAQGLSPDQAAFMASARTLPPSIAQTAAVAVQAGTRPTGIDLAAIERVATMTRGPEAAMVLDLSGGAMGSLASGLRAAGYAEDDRLGTIIWARGADDTRDPAARSDLFGGGIGRASRIRILGDRVQQASSWALIEAPQTAGMRGDLSALVAALDGDGMPPGTLAQAQFFLDLPEGAPIQAVAVADMVDGGQDVGLLVGITTSLSAADAMADAARLAWDTEPAGPAGESYQDLFGAQVIAESLRVDGAAMLVLQSAAEHVPNHPPWRNIHRERFLQILQSGAFWTLID